MAIEINNQGNCESDITGTGIRACDIGTLGDLKGDVLFTKDWYKDITNGSAEFDLAEYIKDVKSFKAIPLKGLQDFTQETPENETNTSSLGVIQEVRSGKPQFSFMFTKGTCFHKALYNKRGQSRWNHGLVFEKGILLATNSDGSRLVGFDGGMFSVETFKLLQGTDLEMSTAKIQLLNATEFNERMIFIPFDMAGAIGDVNGVIETSITVTPPVSDTFVLSLKITSACNKGDNILDLDETTNFVISQIDSVSGAATNTVNAVAYNASTGMYDITVLDAFESTITSIIVSLNDGAYNVVEDSVGNMFKGESASVAVVLA